MEADVVVVGAGVAGLAAAGELIAGGARTVVLEARDRAGGRICTLAPAELDAPVELGAEFVHDMTAGMRDLIDRAGMELLEITGEHWRAEAGRLVRDERLFDRIGGVLAAIGRTVPPDRSVVSALGAVAGLSDEERRQAKQYVEGFHAADASLASAEAIVPAEEGGEEPGAAGRQYRLAGGYDGLVRALAADLPAGSVVFETQVERVGWRRGEVQVVSRAAGGGRRESTAAAAIITLPAGVLFAPAGADGAVRIDPMPPALAAAARGIGVGSAVRVALAFREPFWTALRGEGGDCARDVAFFHTASEQIPVWWTQHPRTTPLLIGWAGGPAARRLGGLDDETLCTTALSVLAEQLGTPRERLESLHCGFWRSRWDDDPFARGAYSYVQWGGLASSRQLQQPIEQTLYFAGEACADGPGRGTVHGALASGRAAARAWLDRRA